jgi:hypothetical protein
LAADTRVTAGINSDGTIATNKVLTASITSNAVTTTSVAQSSGTASSASAEVLLQSLTVTTTGGPLIITFSVFGYSQASGAGSFGCSFRMARDTTGLRASMNYQGNAQASGDRLPIMFTCPIVDQPAAGTYTYYIYGTPSGLSAGINFSQHRVVEVKELKR